MVGANIMLLATIIKVIKAVSRFFSEDVPWTELISFPGQVLALGFVSGVMVWLVLPLSRKLGSLGDALVGLVTMNFFFLCCMFIFDRSLLPPQSLRGLPMLGLATVVGVVLGVWVGRDLRKFIAQLPKPPEEPSPTQSGPRPWDS